MCTYVEFNRCCVLFAIFLFCLFDVVSTERPIITVDYNAAIENTLIKSEDGRSVESFTVKHRNVIIKCESDAPIHWTDAWSVFPTLWAAPYAWNFQESYIYMNSAKLFKGKFHLSYANDSNDKYPYKSDLNLFDIDHKFVGYYYCVKNSSTFSKPNELRDNGENLDHIYLSVRENDEPIHKVTSDIWVWDSCQVAIPCKATDHYDKINVIVNGKKYDSPPVVPPRVYQVPNAELSSKTKTICSKEDGTHAQAIYIHVNRKSKTCNGRMMIMSDTDDFGIEGSTLQLNCIHHNNRSKFRWQLPNNGIAKTEGRVEENNKTGVLIVRNLNKTTDIGAYKCIVDKKNESTLNITRILSPNESFINLTIPSELKFINTSTDSSEVVFLGVYSAYPTPNFTWIDKDRKTKIVEDNANKKIAYHDRNKKLIALIIRNPRTDDSGTYTLIGESNNGKTKMLETVKLAVSNNHLKWLVWFNQLLFSFTMAALSSLLIHQIYRSVKFSNRLKEGDQIGSGHFSRIFIGELLPICPFNKVRKVAIKKILHDQKDGCKLSGTTEILMELNIVKDLRKLRHKHPNVVRFLGAVNENPSKGGIKIVYEFCPHGNLREFIRKNKKLFINQVKHMGDVYIIHKEASVLPESSVYIYSPSSTDGSCENREVDPNTGYLNKRDPNLFIEDPFVESINSTLTPSDQFSTTDLLDWLAQVASGLKFLASNKIIHCDLAARNILLCDNKKVKVSDFGLARKLYADNFYNITSPGDKPLAWTAIESLSSTDPIAYNEKSDVWSFGVVMWELFTLGFPPYIIPYSYLQKDIRLEEPKLKILENGVLSKNFETCMTQKMYNVMWSCWEKEPNDRPSFDELERKLSKMHENALKGIDGDEEMTITVTTISNGRMGHSGTQLEHICCVNPSTSQMPMNPPMELPSNSGFEMLKKLKESQSNNENEENASNRVQEHQF